MAKNDYNTADIVNTTNKDINTGYKIIEETDDKTKDITYDVLCDGELVFSCLTKPLAFAWIEGHKAGNEGASQPPNRSRGQAKQSAQGSPDSGGLGSSNKEKQSDDAQGDKTTKREQAAKPDSQSGLSASDDETNGKDEDIRGKEASPIRLRKMI